MRNYKPIIISTRTHLSLFNTSVIENIFSYFEHESRNSSFMVHEKFIKELKVPSILLSEEIKSFIEPLPHRIDCSVYADQTVFDREFVLFIELLFDDVSHATLFKLTYL